jgi:hypothetical protein
MLRVSVEWHSLRGHPNDRVIKNKQRGATPENSTAFVWVVRKSVPPAGGACHETPASNGPTRSFTCSGVKGLRR